MDKDEPEKSKLFMSKNLLNQSVKDKSKDEEIKPSVYKIKKNNDSIDPLNPKKLSSKKILTQSNEESNNNNITSKEYEENNMYDEKIKSGNKRYNYFQNDEGYEDDEISENNTPKEKPDKNIYNKTNLPKIKQENLQISSELNKILQSTNKKEDVKFLKEENENENVEKNLDENNLKKIKEIDENEKLLENEYIPYKKYINKTKLFIILFSFGIILSLISSCICFFLELYSNQDVLIIIGALSFSSIIIYILWIIFILKDKAYVLLIINSKGNPEKINNSKYRKFILLILYLIITVLNYFIV